MSLAASLAVAGCGAARTAPVRRAAAGRRRRSASGAARTATVSSSGLRRRVSGLLAVLASRAVGCPRTCVVCTGCKEGNWRMRLVAESKEAAVEVVGERASGQRKASNFQSL